ncbi:MAG: hypothetical protein O2782_10670 [bacterium]|nr:hypothetical protein [bacterium]
MHNVILYLIANPFLGLGLSLMVLLCVYNALLRRTRVAMGMWLVAVVVMFYVYVQVSAQNSEMDAVDLAAPPSEVP